MARNAEQFIVWVRGDNPWREAGTHRTLSAAKDAAAKHARKIGTNHVEVFGTSGGVWHFDDSANDLIPGEDHERAPLYMDAVSRTFYSSGVKEPMPEAFYRLGSGRKQNSRTQRYQRIMERQPQWETLEGHAILRVPGEAIAALPTTGRRNAAQFVVFDVATRRELAYLKRDEVTGWLVLRALDREDAITRTSAGTQTSRR